MFRRLFVLTALGIALSGCYMVPMALIGPATSGFTTASIIQSGIGATANYVVKKSTGRTISEHAFDIIDKDSIKQSYLPKKYVTTSLTKKDATTLILPKSKSIK